MKHAPAPPNRLGPKVILLLVGVLVGVLLGSLVYNRSAKAPAVLPVTAAATEARGTPEFKLGQSLAQTWCSSCHLQPEPEVLDKVNWGLDVIPMMGEWLGFRDYPLEEMVIADRVRAANIFPEKPGMSVEEWRAICLYYLEMAPSQVTEVTNRAPLTVGLKHFELMIPTKGLPAFTTLVHIDPAGGFIYTGNTTNDLVVLDASGEELHSLPMGSPPVDISLRPDGAYVTLIGSYMPSDELIGRLVFVGRPGAPEGVNRVILDHLPRPVNTLFADLNGDRREDILICGYGNILGELAWYENQGGDQYVKHVLQDRPGAITAALHDFDKDGKPDIAVMFAQAREGIELLMNKGGGQFDRVPVVDKHPAWGFAHLELVDANGDGAMDLLACNGDNGDHTRHIPPYKPYHGIRLYLNDGKNHFTEAWFEPLNGAYKTITRDFDQDGDLDIASISFYPDYRRYPREGFVYLENTGGWNFKPYSFEESLRGRWLTMDAGDVDKDGDLDIVLGAFVDGPTHVPGALQDRWREYTPHVFILKNTLKK